jgi:hypothetical protein
VPTADFAPFADDFLRFAHETVWCALTTLDRHNRPRGRMIHPLWELVDGRPVGWFATRRSPIKTAHLAHSPAVSCTYWRPTHDTVLIQATACWVEDPATRVRVWQWFGAVDPPLGYDLATIWPAGPTDPDYGLLRIEPWRVQLVTVDTLTTRTPRVWTAAPLPAPVGG